MDQPLLQLPPTTISVKRIPQRAPKFRPIVFISVLLVLLAIAIIIRSADSQGSSSAKPSQQWVPIQTFSGSGLQKTPVFTVSKNWRVVWSCNIASNNNTDYYLFIHAYTTKNALLNNSVETTCSKNNTHGVSQVSQGGRIYLSILSQGSWSIQVQNMK